MILALICSATGELRSELTDSRTPRFLIDSEVKKELTALSPFIWERDSFKELISLSLDFSFEGVIQVPELVPLVVFWLQDSKSEEAAFLEASISWFLKSFQMFDVFSLKKPETSASLEFLSPSIRVFLFDASFKKFSHRDLTSGEVVVSFKFCTLLMKSMS